MTEKRNGSGVLEILIGIVLLLWAAWLLIDTVTTDGANPLSGVFAIVIGGLGVWAFIVGRKKRATSGT